MTAAINLFPLKEYKMMYICLEGVERVQSYIGASYASAICNMETGLKPGRKRSGYLDPSLEPLIYFIAMR